ncbi:hypothetical protein BDY24DRAFT_172552 [Mrakia frigida]|uniref:uncharacterized protein n=1 Tax=Mrakia frigida TaxID=29902 RepID=UPI003FCC1F12
MNSSDPPPSPTRLPYDILSLIVQETIHDAPSLSAWCLVSFAMLELAAPLLYEKIELKKEKDYIDLFSDPVSPDLYISLSRRARRWAGWNRSAKLTLSPSSLLFPGHRLP